MDLSSSARQTFRHTFDSSFRRLRGLPLPPTKVAEPAQLWLFNIAHPQAAKVSKSEQFSSSATLAPCNSGTGSPQDPGKSSFKAFFATHSPGTGILKKSRDAREPNANSDSGESTIYLLAEKRNTGWLGVYFKYSAAARTAAGGKVATLQSGAIEAFRNPD
jgi:hypothetical protein